MIDQITVVDVHVSTVIEGVEFALLDGRRRLRVLVVAPVLEQEFGAVRGPESWMQAFQMNQDVIIRRVQAMPDSDPIIVK